MFSIYNEIKETKDEGKLIKMLESQELKPDQINDQGQTPLMVAIDFAFSTNTIERLIELGCDVNAQNDED